MLHVPITLDKMLGKNRVVYVIGTTNSLHKDAKPKVSSGMIIQTYSSTSRLVNQLHAPYANIALVRVSKRLHGIYTPSAYRHAKSQSSGRTDVLILEGSGLSVKDRLLQLLCGACFLIGFASGDACVVHEDVQVLFALRDLVEKAPDRVFVADVGSERDDLSNNIFSVGFDDTIELLLCAPNDISSAPFTVRA
jgi:hypothetical protein